MNVAGPAAKTILIADGNDISRQTARRVITRRYPECRILESTTTRETLRVIGGRAPDIVILDPHLANGSGVRIRDEILRRRRPDTYLILITSDGGPEYESHALDAGVDFFVSRTATDSPRRLIDAVDAAIGQPPDAAHLRKGHGTR